MLVKIIAGLYIPADIQVVFHLIDQQWKSLVDRNEVGVLIAECLAFISWMVNPSRSFPFERATLITARRPWQRSACRTLGDIVLVVLHAVPSLGLERRHRDGRLHIRGEAE